jgi:hypothetical protein
MSERGRRNRSRGRFQGQERGNTSEPTITTTSSKESTPALGLSDHTYDVGDPANAGKYITNTRFMMTYIRKTYNHGARIAQSLEERRLIQEPLPEMQQSISKDQDVLDRENEQYRELNRIEFKAYVEDKRAYKKQLERVYGLLLSQCSQTLQHKIETSSEFATKITDDPVALLGLIERLSVSAASTRHPYDLVVDSWINLVKTKQQEEETVLEYTHKFMPAKEMCEALEGGPCFGTSSSGL